MSSLFSLITLIYIWFIFNHSKIIRFSKRDKNIILKSLKSEKKEVIEKYVNTSFSEYLKDSKNFRKAITSFIFSFEDDYLWFFKSKNIKNVNVEKIKWYFKKKKKIENFLEYNILNTKIFEIMNNSGVYMREIGATDISCMQYMSLKDKRKIYFGSSKNNLNEITYKYLKDYIVLERWRRRYLSK